MSAVRSIAISLTLFICLYVGLLVVDIWLMRRYAERDPAQAEPEEGVPAAAY